MNIEYLDAVVYKDNERRFQTTLYQKEVGHQKIFIWKVRPSTFCVFKRNTSLTQQKSKNMTSEFE